MTHPRVQLKLFTFLSDNDSINFMEFFKESCTSKSQEGLVPFIFLGPLRLFGTPEPGTLA